MKNYLLAFATLLFVSCNLVAKEQVYERSISLSEPDKLADIEVMLMNGSISIEGYKGNSIEILARVKSLDKVSEGDERKRLKTKSNKTSQVKKDDPRKGLTKVANTGMQLEIEKRGNSVSIGTMNRNQYVELTLKVPFKSDLELQLHRGGDINVNNVQGSLDIQNLRGGIKATGIIGPIVAESVRKDVVVVFKSFNAEKPSSLNAHGGNVDISIPKKSKVRIEIKSYQGEIYSGIDSKFESIDNVEEGDANSDRHSTIVGGAMAASLNGGTQKLMINTFKGDVFVRSH